LSSPDDANIGKAGWGSKQLTTPLRMENYIFDNGTASVLKKNSIPDYHQSNEHKKDKV
jgi:hypothetical protein